MNCPTRSCGVSVGAYPNFLVAIYIPRNNFATHENGIGGWVVAQVVSVVHLPSHNTNSLAFQKPKPNLV